MGTGPGAQSFMCGRAVEVLSSVEVVAGYTTYLDLIRPLIQDKEIIGTAMKKEVERVEAAISTAMNGRVCAIISGGDAGVYAMAGLVFEICAKRNIRLDQEGKNSLFIEVVPGIPALAAGAALLGAPLTHDFAAISLSDLLTPWETIEKRLEAAAAADFVIVLYNPKSKKRDWQLEAARQIILKSRGKDTPVGVTTGAMRDNQSVEICTLETLDKADVGMQTAVFIGNSSTFTYDGRMITPRGYDGKYKL